MKQQLNFWIGIVLLSALFAQAENSATIRFQNGAVRTLKSLTVQDGNIFLPDDQISVAISTIANIDMTFDTLSLQQCETLYRSGEFRKLAKLLDAALTPLKMFEAFPGNLDPFVRWQLRANFWIKKYDVVFDRADLLKTRKSPFVDEASLYAVLALIEEKKITEATNAFAAIQNPEAISPAMTEVIRGRLAMAEKKYSEALQHFANGVVHHGRDAEWLPAATFYEGMVCRKTGYLVAALNIAEELELAYPDSIWSRRAVELK